MAISFDNPVATHKITHIPSGSKYLFCVIGNTYRWKDLDGDWRPNLYHDFGFYAINKVWAVEKIKQFKGNV